MASSNQSHQRSPFAESAYAHAERRERRRQATYDMRYEDVNVVHAEFQPLAGASVVIIIANISRTDNDSTRRSLMEELESIGCAVESLGGGWIPNLSDDVNRTITHAIWIESGKHSEGFSHETLVKLNTCLSMDIPVVSPRWLDSIGELRPGQHWSEVNVEDHIPRTIKEFYNVNSVQTEHYIYNNKSLGSNSFETSRRDDVASLNASISETYQTLIDENPDVLDEEALQRAMELSMLDFAIVHHSPNKKLGWMKKKNKDKSPHEILSVQENATPDEIKNAYRRRALETHPDKGGKPGEFEAVARAYRLLLNAANNNDIDGGFDKITLKSTAHWDSELKEHRNLVREMYQSHGEDMADHLGRQNFALERLGLTHKEAGSQNRNEKDELIRNSCFYLSLATSYLSGIGALAVWCHSGDDIDSEDRRLLREADDALIKETALQLKRVIEAAVLTAHPEWAQSGMVGEEVQAFSDFLVYILESQTIISDWSVVVFDTASGFADIYKGQNYKEDESYSASNTLTLRFVPGHYTPLVAATPDSTRPTLKQIISVLEESGVLYVVTDGAAPE